MSKVLSRDVFEKKKELESKLRPITSNIVSRLDYILRKIGEICDAKIDGWYIEGADEGKVGDVDKAFNFPHYIEKNVIVVYSNAKNKGNADYNVNLGDGEWDLSYQIPLRWMFENFEDELKDGKNNYLKQIELNKISKKVKRQKKSGLLRSAKSKLTKEELKALGLT